MDWRWQTLCVVSITLLIGAGAGVLLMRDDDGAFYNEAQTCERRAVVGRNLVCLD